jgi:iron complex outermembrane receptor protein
MIESAISLGATTHLARDWTATAYLSHSLGRERAESPWINPDALARALADPNPLTALNPFGDGSYTAPETLAAIHSDENETHVDNTLWTIDALAQGELTQWHQRPVLLVLGVNQRRQSFELDLRQYGDMTFGAHRAREVTALYAEVRLPVIAKTVEASFAARHERDQDFGNVTAPRIGLTWSAFEYARLRASWARSFQSPALEDLNESGNYAGITMQRDPTSPSGFSPTLSWHGGSSSLRQESAETLSFGLDAFVPEQALSLELTYFHTDFHDRVDRLMASNGNELDAVSDLLTNPEYSDLVIRNPSAALREDVCRRSPLADPVACLNAPIVAILDLRWRNAVRTDISGIDFRAKRPFNTSAGQFDLGVVGSYLIDFSERTLARSPRRQLLDTPNHPLRLKTKALAGWMRGPWRTDVTLNFNGAYRDPDTRRGIDAWKTVDAGVSYQYDGIALSLAVENLFNTMPGFWNNPQGVGYDYTNSNLIGRYARIEARRHW